MNRRTTRQRSVVQNVLRTLYHPTAEEVVTAVRAQDPTIGRATVFRNLSVLCGEGEIVRLLFPGEPTRFDTNSTPHDHFVCRRCGRIIDLPASEGSLPALEGFTVESRSATFAGLCPVCAEEKETEEPRP